jgi:hypothetical protein
MYAFLISQLSDGLMEARNTRLIIANGLPLQLHMLQQCSDWTAASRPPCAHSREESNHGPFVKPVAVSDFVWP